MEEQLVELVVIAMERSESELPPNPANFPGGNTSSSENSDDQSHCHWLWLHLSSQLIYFQLFQHASFPNIVIALHDKVNF